MIKVKLPDGTQISVDTDDPQKASLAAKKFLSNNVDAQPKKAGFVKDLFTGENRKTDETESTPSLLDVGVKRILPNVNKLRLPKIMAALSTTTDPVGIFNIIENNSDEPVNLDRDLKGNFFLNVGDGDNRRRIIINPPGIDATDAVQFGVLASAFTPAGRLGALATTTKGAAASVGGGSAVTQAALNNLQQKQGRDASAGQISSEILLSGLLGGLSEGALRLAGPKLREALAGIQGADDVGDDLLGVYQQAAAEIGVNPRQVTRQHVAQIANQLDDAVDENRLGAVASEIEFPDLPLTKGERTGSTRQLKLEDDLRSGIKGDKAQETFTSFETRQALGATDEASRIKNQLSDDGNIVNNNDDLFSELSPSLIREEQGAKSVVDEAFDQIGDASLDKDSFTRLLDATDQSLDNIEFNVVPGLTDATIGFKSKMAALKTQMANVDGEVQPVHIKQINGLRKSLGSLVRNTKGEDRRNLTKMMGAYDDFLDEAIANGLFQGDTNSLQALKDANIVFGRYASLFRKDRRLDRFGNKINDKAGELIEKMIAQDPSSKEVVNAIFGASKLSNPAGARIVNRFERILGRDSDGFKAIKQAAFERLLKTNSSQRRVNGNLQSIEAISGQQSLKNFRSTMKENSEMMRAIFSNEEINKINRFLQQVKRTQPDLSNARSRVNPSGTAQKLNDVIKNPLNNIFPGITFKLTSLGVALTKESRGKGLAKAAIRPFAGITRRQGDKASQAAQTVVRQNIQDDQE